MSEPNPSLRWLTLAVLVPLLVLAALALLGIRAQTRAAWSAAREEAKGILSNRTTALARDLTEQTATMPLFPDPPVPGPVAAGSDPLAGQDATALAALRDDPNAGMSAAGLPRRVLAALRLAELDPVSQSPETLVALVISVPSVLTATVLERLGEPAKPTLERWRHGEQALALWRHSGDGWQPAGDGVWWVGKQDRQLRFLTSEALRKSLAAQSMGLPAWAALELRDGKIGGGQNARAPVVRAFCPRPCLTEQSAPGEALASAPVDFGSDLRLQVIAVSPALIEQNVRRQAVWTLSVLALAVAVSAAALGLMHRIVRQERRLGELKSQFVSSVSHELRAPVGSIRLMAEALHDGKVTGEAAAEFHRLIAGEGARLSHLVENVLDFARIEEGRKRYRFEEGDLRLLAADVIRLLEPLAAERGVKLSADLAECTATVDPAAIQQALVNLVDNAVKFSPAGGTVTVSLTSEAAAWSVAVRDEGPGIPAAEHERIFERFHRLGNELRRETQGTGIGLSIVKHIAEAHGGRVTVTSQPGHGSTFAILVPLRLLATGDLEPQITQIG